MKLEGTSLATAQGMWVRGVLVETIADACGCGVSEIYKAARRCKFPRRRRGQDGVMEMQEDDPTPAAIAAGALRLRLAHMAERRGEA
jgi:hypothetical protein